MARPVLSIAGMNVSLFQAAAALNANSRWQEVIAQNLASSSVPGFKKQELCVAAIQAGLMPASGLGSSPQAFMIPKASSAVSFQQGEMKYSGNSNDLAIEGQGFFEIQAPNGSSVFTRDGEFHVSSTGRLVTKQGYPVLGTNGPIQLNPSNPAPLSVSATGVVTQGAQQLAQLKITEFQNPQLLTQINGAYFRADNPGLVTQPSTSTVRQGFVEASNVSPLGEMAGMMSAMRGFEAGQHLIQIQDDRMGKAISELGNPT